MTKIDADMNVIEENVDDVFERNDASEVETFATEEAPWVGAEAAFRHSLLPLPHEEAELYPRMVFGESVPERPRESISDHEFETIVTSMAPPRLANRFLTSATAAGGVLTPIRVVSYVVVASLMLLLGWVIVDSKGSVQTLGEVDTTQGPDVVGAGQFYAADLSVRGNGDGALAIEDEGVGTADDGNSENAVAVMDFSLGSVEGDLVAKESPDGNAQHPRHARSDGDRAKRRSLEKLARDVGETSGSKSAQGIDVSPTEAASDVTTLGANTPAPARGGLKRGAATEPLADGLPSMGMSGLTERDSALVKQTLSILDPEVKRCRNGRSGTLTMTQRVSGRTGRVISVEPLDAAAVGNAAALCVRRVLRFAKFPRFESSPITFDYTFKL